jgi:hypothetical protein
MSKYLQIQIPKACHENWDKMDSSEQGRFCNSCQKNVVDFTLMNDDDLVDFFKKNTGNICGRLTASQLQTDHLIPGKKIPWLKYFFQITVPVFLFSAKANAQIGKVAVTQKHVVDKKRVKSQIPIVETKVTCNIEPVSPDAVSSQATTGEVVIIAGGITSRTVIKENKFSLPWFSRPYTLPKFSIYPNPIPSSSQLNIKWKNNISSDQSIEIYNQTGNLLQQEIISANKKLTQGSIDLKQLPAGAYVLKITDNKTHKSSSQQFIVE